MPRATAMLIGMVRLRRSDTAGPGIRRVRSGKGFRYQADAGASVSAEDRERIEALVIPPAWEDVWISRFNNGHVQATGVDAAGRRQYLYHEAWRAKKDLLKFDRMLELAESLPKARGRVTRDLRSDGLGRDRVLAAAFRMLDVGGLRIGSARYQEQNGSHGLSTLLVAHTGVRGATVSLRFPAKSGQQWESQLDDADLAAVVKVLRRRAQNATLLAWKEGRAWRTLDASDINGYVREQTGGEFTAKDFRTLHGSVVAAQSLARHGTEATKTARARAVTQAMRDVAEELGNTPAVARSSYVDPRIIDHYDHGRTISRDRLDSAESELRRLLN